jgi:hypothetical protein
MFLLRNGWNGKKSEAASRCKNAIHGNPPAPVRITKALFGYLQSSTVFPLTNLGCPVLLSAAEGDGSQG